MPAAPLPLTPGRPTPLSPSRVMKRLRYETAKRTTAHTFRHGFATHLIEAGYDSRTVRELLGQQDVRTTMVYAHILNRGGRGGVSPANFDLPEPGETQDSARALSCDVSEKH